MANMRLKVWESAPLAHDVGFNARSQTNLLWINGYDFLGSISFNSVAVVTAVSGSITVSLGLYSLNGSTLSLANSASATGSSGAAGSGWMTFATSATQDISPGKWWIAIIQATGGASINLLTAGQAFAAGKTNGTYPGTFIWGHYSTTNGLPTSIATSDASLIKDGAASYPVGGNYHPYIVIGG